MHTFRLYALIGLLVLVAGAALLIFHKGGSAPRAEAKAAKSEAKAAQAEVRAITESVQVSQQTAERVDVEAAEVRQRAEVAKEAIHETIFRDPAGTDPAGDAAVVRASQEAYAAAIRASCRVQRTNDCNAP